MPFLDWSESQVDLLELRARNPYSSDDQAKAQIASLRASLLKVDHVLGEDGLAVVAGERIVNQWKRLCTIEEKLCP